MQIEVKGCGLSPNLTHLVVDRVSEENEAVATAGYYEALVMGAWIVNEKWTQECLNSNGFVDEGDYEVVGATKAVRGGPMEARLNRMKHLPKLFDGMHVYLYGSFDKPYPNRTELTAILRRGGAVVLKREPDPEAIPQDERGRRPYHSDPEGPLSKCSHFIVYQEGSKKEPAIKYKMDHVKSLPAAWLFECIHNFKLVDPFC